MTYYALYKPKGFFDANTDPDDPNILFAFEKGRDRDLFVHKHAGKAYKVSAKFARQVIVAANEYGNDGRTPGDGHRDGRSWNFLDTYPVKADRRRKGTCCMKLVVWPPREGGALEYEVKTLEEVWSMGNTLQPGAEGDFVLELSSNTETDGTHYLVLSWVEVVEEA